MRQRAAVRWIAAILGVLYALVVARLTLAPADAEAGMFSLLNRLAIELSGGHLDWTRTEILANIALFVPAGFLLAIACGRVWLSVLACIAASMLIEWAQARYLPSRVPSWADVRHNGLGGLLGAAMAWPIASWTRSRPRAPVPTMPQRQLVGPLG